MDPRTPVIVGVGQVNHPSPMAPEPIELLTEASRSAAGDSGSDRLLGAIESIRLVRILSRGYPDPAALLADRIGAHPRHRATTTDGGNHPQALVNRTAQQIARGELDVALIGGAESWRTRNAYRRSGTKANWSQQDPAAAPTEIYGDDRPFFHPAEDAVGIWQAVQMYPIFETALRARLGLDATDHRRRVAELWSRFSEVASRNPYAALRRPHTAAEIAEAGPSNRMVCDPYPKLMNSNNSVDQAAALVMCSAARARELGVDEDRWVYPVSGADGNDTATVSTRLDLAASPAIRVTARAALSLAGVGCDDLDFVDIYSCFPSAVQIAAREIGLPIDRQLTLTGGLTFAGGPWNNYSSHAIATLVPRLREQRDSYGLITANGGMLTKHAIGVYSGRPPREGFRAVNVQPEIDALGSRAVAEDHHGPITVEAHTVEYDREGHPARLIAAGLTEDGARAWHSTDDPALIDDALAATLVGAEIKIGKA